MMFASLRYLLIFSDYYYSYGYRLKRLVIGSKNIARFKKLAVDWKFDGRFENLAAGSKR